MTPLRRSARTSKQTPRRPRAVAGILALIVGATAGCGSDRPTGPQEPEAPIDAPVFLEDSELLPGGHGVLLSAGFAGLDLEPARDEEGAVIPDRWTNLGVTIDGEEVDSRRLDATRIQFDVPVRTAGDVTLRVETPGTISTTTARVRGLLASRRVDECAANDFTTLVPVGAAVVLGLYCPDTEGAGARLGYALVSPGVDDPDLRWIEGLYFDREPGDGMRTAVIHPGPSTRAGSFVARRPGPTTEPLDMWLWDVGPAGGDPGEGGDDPGEGGPLEPLTCFPDGSGDDVTSAVADLAGACIAFQAGFVRRDGIAIAECCVSDERVTFVLSPDGSAALRHVRDLVVFDREGHIDFRLPYARIIDDVAFSRDGERVYAVAARDDGVSTLDVRDRRTAELLDRLELDGRVAALAVAGDRLWLTREAAEGPFAVELYDAGTLEHRRTILLPRSGLAPPQDEFTGELAVLRQNEAGTRLHLTSVVAGIVRSDAIEVF